MTNIVGYRCLPDRQEFEILYQTRSQLELASIYKCGKVRIRKWILEFGLPLRKIASGKGNAKYSIDRSVLENFISLGMTDDQIACELSMSPSNVKRLIKKHSLGRKYNTSEYKLYCRKVRYYSEFSYTQHHKMLNPDNHPRTLCGVKDGYQLDHKRSVRECFEHNISIEECSHVDNLQLISWQDNLKKRKFNSGRLINV